MNNQSDILDHYLTIQQPVTGEYKEKGSKFLAYAYNIDSEGAFSEKLDVVKKLHPKGRHHCYAYRLGVDKNLFRSNDDGEPSGTAGRPILGSIDSHNLSDTGVIVVRYFGGTKLGVSGLIQAYRAATNDALGKATIKDVYITTDIEMKFDYAHLGVIMDALKSLQIEIKEKRMDAKPSLILGLRISQEKKLIRKIKAILLKRDVEDIDDETVVPFCNFE